MTFATDLIRFRAKHNLSQEKIAGLLGVTTAMIYRYERGISKPSRKNQIMFETILKEYESK